MKLRIMATILALLGAAPLAAQRHETYAHVQEGHGRRLEIRVSGDVQFSDEGDWVERIGRGGSVRLEEEGPGIERRLVFTPAARGTAVRFWENDRERPMSPESRAWAQRTLRRAVREGALGARTRVPRIRARHGVRGVLNEIATLRNESARRIYFTTLLDSGPLSQAEFGQVMQAVERGLRSDTETRLVLMHAVPHAGGARLTSVLRAMGGIESDTEVRLVLHRVLEQGRGLDPAADDAFFGVLETLGSDTERRLVLSRLLDHPAAEGTVVGALRAAAGMRSDTEKRLVLGRVPGERLRSARVREAYRHVLETMRSDSERSLALRRLAAEL